MSLETCVRAFNRYVEQGEMEKAKQVFSNYPDKLEELLNAGKSSPKPRSKGARSRNRKHASKR